MNTKIYKMVVLVLVLVICGSVVVSAMPTEEVLKVCDFDEVFLGTADTYGDSTGSGISSDTAHTGNFSYKLISAGGTKRWASLGINLKPSVDVSEYEYLRFWIKGANGGERFWISLIDERRNYDNPTCRMKFSAVSDQWQEISIPISDIKGVNLKELVQIAVHFGSEAWGQKLNPVGTTLYVDDFEFAGKETAIVTPTSITTPTEIPPIATPTSEEKAQKGVPAFEALFSIAGLLAVAYLLKRREYD